MRVAAAAEGLGAASGVTLVPVERADDDRLADYVRLRETSLRKHLESEQGLFIAEGEKVIRRAVEAGGTAGSSGPSGPGRAGRGGRVGRQPLKNRLEERFRRRYDQ